MSSTFAIIIFKMSRTYKRNSDWHVPKIFKRFNRQEERNKQNLREGKEIPNFRTRDKWE